MNVTGDAAKNVTVKVNTATDDLFECRVAVYHEGSAFSVFALDLPGVVSCGETPGEAMRSIREALEEALLEYRSSGGIPWERDGALLPVGCEKIAEKRIVVNG